MEYLKWGKLLIFFKLPTEKKSISFASGMISDFLIPGIPSNFIGRIGYFESNQRMSLAAWISLTNSIQFFITALFGLFSIFLLKSIDEMDIQISSCLAHSIRRHLISGIRLSQPNYSMEPCECRVAMTMFSRKSVIARGARLMQELSMSPEWVFSRSLR